MKKMFWLITGITAGMVIARRIEQNPAAKAVAEDLIKSPSSAEIELVIFATPIGALSSVLNGEYQANPKAAFIDIGSVKSKVKVEVSTSSLPLQRFLPTHPMAGRAAAPPFPCSTGFTPSSRATSPSTSGRRIRSSISKDTALSSTSHQSSP